MQGRNSSTLTKAPPHNSAACLAMSFPPSAACKFLDLPPVNLRNLHLHLTKNPFASRPPHLCGVTLKNLRNKPSSMGVSAPKGSRGRSESPLSLPQERNLLQQEKSSNMGVTAPKVSKGRSQTSFVFMPFGRVRRRETLCDKQNQAANYPKSRAALPQRSAISFMGMIRFRRGLSRAG